MSFETIDALWDEPHAGPFEDCQNCRAALATPASPDKVFLGRTFRQMVARRHDEAIRHARLLDALLRPCATDGQVVTYEITDGGIRS